MAAASTAARASGQAAAQAAAWLGAAALLAGNALPRSESTAELPPDRLAIALKVAGPGLPHCRSYHPDGSEGPCLPRFVLVPGRRINGWSAAGLIRITRGAADRLDPDAFALLAGHEIAHWYLGHAPASPAAELAADRLGAELACRAGYDVARGAGLLAHLTPDRVHPRREVREAVVLGVECGGGGGSF
jgi:hypothetical protein